MSTTTRTADAVIRTLREHEAELRAAGITRLTLFGSVARGEEGPDSDVDLAAEFDPAARMDLIRLVGLERRLADLLGRPVEVVPLPVQRPRLIANMARDSIHVL